MIIPRGFTPSGAPPDRHAPTPSVQLAFEVLVGGDQVGGRACVIPQATFIEIADIEGLPINEVPMSIAAKEGKPCGRLVVDATRGGLNSDEKRALLAKRSASFIHDVDVHTLESIRLTYMTPQRS